MKIAILQSNYIPWKGYFDIIQMADVFVLYDEVQYTRRNWRNRNRIKTPSGLSWITIPVEVKGKYHQSIKDTKISDYNWNKAHWKMLCHNYAKATNFRNYKDVLETLYARCNDRFLSDINYKFLTAINDMLGIKTRLTWSMDYPGGSGKTERLLNICKKLKATEYISGPSGKSYIDEKSFHMEGIKIHWMDYSNYPIYRQLYPPFEHGVTILDLIFNEGPNSIKYMKRYQNKSENEKG